MNKEYLDYDGLRHYHTNVAGMIDEVDAKLESAKSDLTMAVNQKEATANKVGSWQSTPDDTHYPTEKLVKDSLDGKSDIGHTHSISDVTNLQNTLDGVNTSINNILIYLSIPLPTQWNYISSIDDFSDHCYAYGNGKFVAVGAAKSGYSYDLTQWTYTNKTFAVSSTLMYGLFFAGGKFFCFSNSIERADVFVSNNGASWTDGGCINNTGSRLYGMAFGNGLYIACGASGQMFYSSDCKTWTGVSQSIFSSSDSIYSIIYGQGNFIAASNKKLALSTDGLNWIENSSIPLSSFNGLYYDYDDNTIYCYGEGTNPVMFSTNGGSTWSPLPLGIDASSVRGFCKGNGKYILTSNGTLYYKYSLGSPPWVRTKANVAAGGGRWLEYCGDRFVAFGQVRPQYSIC